MYIFYTLYSYKSCIILIKKIQSYYRYLKCFDFFIHFVETEEHITKNKKLLQYLEEEINIKTNIYGVQNYQFVNKCNCHVCFVQ